MRSRGLLIFIAWWLGGVWLAAEPLHSARQAQALLGTEAWSQVVKIKNVRSNAVFPSVVFALVFEFEDRLWFYFEKTGTESLSLERGRLERDKRDLGPLLRAINPGFRRYEVLPASHADEATLSNRPLPRGCFIDAVVYFQQLMDSGERLEDARLLAYYADARLGFAGHTLLYFVKAGRRFYYDASESPQPHAISDLVPNDPLAIARVTFGGSAFVEPSRAKFLPLKIPEPPLDRATNSSRPIQAWEMSDEPARQTVID